MKLYSVTIFRCSENRDENPVMLSSHFDLSSFGFFQKNSAKEFITFFSRTFARSCERGAMTQVEKDAYVCYIYSEPGSTLASVIAADAEYPSRVAFDFSRRAVDAFRASNPGATSGAMPSADNTLAWPEGEEMLKRYSNPVEADKVLRIQKDLADTKQIMHQAIEQVLDRGENMDRLVEKSSDLSSTSRGFYQTAKKTNACCKWSA